MGRIIHTTFTKDNLGRFDSADMKVFSDITDKYNAGDLEHIWTCENFWIRPFDGLNENSFTSFIKVQGNELNSLLIFEACLEISKRVKDCTIKMYDEGEFLLCPIKMKMGKVLPVLSDMLDDLRRYSWRMLSSSKYRRNVLDRFDYKAEDFGQAFQMDIGLDNSYGDQVPLINEKLRNLKLIETAISKEWKLKPPAYFGNISSLDYRLWFSPYAFTRQVDVEKFKDYEGGLKNLLDGFDGEGFGLTDVDPEKKSYEAIAELQSFLKRLGFTEKNGFTMEILKKVRL
jgi:hypothetical protein